MGKQDNDTYRNQSRRNPGLGGIPLQEVFGYPPDNIEPRTNQMIKKSFPVARFFPSMPQFQKGLSLFTLRPAWKEYTELLKENGYASPNTDSIQLAFLADNFPTDSFSNEYGENFLQGMTTMASQGASSLAQIMGASSASEAYGNLQSNIASSDNAFAQMFAKAMGVGGDMAKVAKDALSSIPAIGGAAGKGVNLIDRLAAGARIDFPMVWKSSTFQPSYSLTVRLYNPFPQSEEATRRFITGPIAAIMLLGVPRAENASTYTWPFLHRIECPGIYTLNPGFISNITIVKGGDQQQISLQNRLGMVDVRIDMGSLYSSMLGGSSKVTARRPTVLEYTNAMTGQDAVTTREFDNKGVETITQNNNIFTRRGAGRVNNQGFVSPKRAATSEDYSTTPKARVTAAAEAVYAELKKLNPFD